MRLIIGYGNPLRVDDGLGPYLAETLARDWAVITGTQLMPEFAEPISRAEQVVFIDAEIGEAPGHVTCEKLEAMLVAGAFTHTVTPASLLKAAQDLYNATPQAMLITIIGASFDYGDAFSPQISTLLPQIARKVDEMIVTFFAHPAWDRG